MLEAIKIISWRPGLKNVDLINLVKEIDQGGLAKAKKKVDRFLQVDGVPIELLVAPNDRDGVIGRLKEIGVVVDEKTR